MLCEFGLEMHIHAHVNQSVKFSSADGFRKRAKSGVTKIGKLKTTQE